MQHLQQVSVLSDLHLVLGPQERIFSHWFCDQNYFFGNTFLICIDFPNKIILIFRKMSKYQGKVVMKKNILICNGTVAVKQNLYSDFLI